MVVGRLDGRDGVEVDSPGPEMVAVGERPQTSPMLQPPEFPWKKLEPVIRIERMTNGLGM